MYFNWTFPWTEAESLLGILVANGVEVTEDETKYSCSLLSLGLIIGRVDFIFNSEEITEE